MQASVTILTHDILPFFFYFFKELRLIFPNSQRLNRGNYVLSQLVQACRSNEVTDLILIHEHRGQPGRHLYMYLLN